MVRQRCAWQRCLTPGSYSCSLHHATPRPNLLIYISFCRHVLFKSDEPLPRSCVVRVDRSIGPPPLVLFQLKKVPLLLPTASFPGPFTRKLLTRWQTLSDLSERRAARPARSSDRCSSSYMATLSQSSNALLHHESIQDVGYHPPLVRMIVSGHRALDFSGAE
jgi:hypothetical protein